MYLNNKDFKLYITKANQSISDFSSIDEKKFDFLNQKALELRKRFNKEILKDDYIDKLMYYMFSLKIRWKINLSFEEKWALLIMIIDPKYLIYRIYENSSKINQLQNKMIKAFGFYSYELIVLERKFIEQFDDINIYRFDIDETKKLEFK